MVAAHGVRGEVRVWPETDSLGRFCRLQEVYLRHPPGGGEEGPAERWDRYSVEKARPHQHVVLLKLAGVDSRSAAEALRGSWLAVPERQAEKPEGCWFIHDILGLQAVDETGSAVGQVVAVLRSKAHDLFEVQPPEPGAGSFLVPAVREFVRDVDLKQRRLVLHLWPGLRSEPEPEGKATEDAKQKGRGRSCGAAGRDHEQEATHDAV